MGLLSKITGAISEANKKIVGPPKITPKQIESKSRYDYSRDIRTLVNKSSDLSTRFQKSKTASALSRLSKDLGATRLAQRTGFAAYKRPAKPTGETELTRQWQGELKRLQEQPIYPGEERQAREEQRQLQNLISQEKARVIQGKQTEQLQKQIKEIKARKEGGYSRDRGIKSSRRVAIAGAFGTTIPKKLQAKQSRPGRPKGTYEDKYAQYGGVFGYRKFMRKQEALRRLAMQYPDSAQAQQFQRQQFQQAQIESMQQYPQSYPQPQPTQPRFQVRQVQPQRLSVPQVGVGSTTGYTNVNGEINILHAPNPFKGELRNVGMGQAYPNATDLQRPITNPSGDQFSQPDLFSGRTILQTRSRERWLR